MPKEKKRLSKRAIKILRWVQEQITAEPLRLDMGRILATGEETLQMYKRRPACNTVGCIAGWISQYGKGKVKPIYDHDAEEKAYVLLGSTFDSSNQEFFASIYGLFYTRWPHKLKQALEKTNSQTKPHAKVVCKAIDEWIEGDGRFKEDAS